MDGSGCSSFRDENSVAVVGVLEVAVEERAVVVIAQLQVLQVVRATWV